MLKDLMMYKLLCRLFRLQEEGFVTKMIQQHSYFSMYDIINYLTLLETGFLKEVFSKNIKLISKMV